MVTHHCIEPESFGYRVVFAFVEGQFTLDEIERFMCDLVGSSGTAPVAEDYFKAYNSDSRINTGGISFQKDMHIPTQYWILWWGSMTSSLSMNYHLKSSKQSGLVR